MFFFTHLGRVVAILGLAIGILQIVAGSRDVTGLDVALVRRLDISLAFGAYLVAFSIVLGILTEISYALRSLKVP
jgi:hypothetical protein